MLAALWGTSAPVSVRPFLSFLTVGVRFLLSATILLIKNLPLLDQGRVSNSRFHVLLLLDYLDCKMTFITLRSLIGHRFLGAFDLCLKYSRG
jgi:hypothetical protein